MVYSRLKQFMYSLATHHQIVYSLIVVSLIFIMAECFTRIFTGPLPYILPKWHQFNPHTLWENKKNYCFTEKSPYGIIEYKTNQYGFRAPKMNRV